jgi:DNA modification methylase
MRYDKFLDSKRVKSTPVGFDVPDESINPMLFPFQRAVVQWALRRGRAALFEDCGLGKTPQQLEWARHVCERTGRRVLILAPLAVAQQTRREGDKFGIPVTVCRTSEDVRDGVNVTNYDRLHHFDASMFSGLVLDESSILKSFEGTVRKQITEFARQIHYRLACTATPAPNDLVELTNHAEFLDIMQGKEIIALFFTQDGNTTHAWRLKGHAKHDFWKWLASWSVAIRRPSDLGYPNDGFVLPPLNLIHDSLDCGATPGFLFAIEAVSLQEVRAAQRGSLDDRVAKCAEMVNASNDPWLVWCNLNVESEALTKAIPGAVEVKGADSVEHKESALMDFSAGKIRVLVTKPSLAGFGMNWQHCNHVAFVGLSYSYEQFYQAVRRCWRFGQTRPVECHIITAKSEGAVVATIERKERQASEMFENITAHMQGLQLDRADRDEMTYRQDVATGNNWTLYLGDSVKMLELVETDSVGLTVTSPPFPGMYAYTNSPRDMGNTTGIKEMLDHFEFLIPQLFRVTMPGRLFCVHLMQLTAMKSRDGYIGIKDYRGKIINAVQAGGFVYSGEVTIEKNPQIQAVRNKERGLLFKSLATDSAVMRMALGDYLIQFRKPGENPRAIQAGISEKYGSGHGWITEEEWIEWASPVWYRQRAGFPGGIRETEVLNVSQARDTDDERHLCPLQLGVIERAVKLWSAPGDLVLDPFSGVGSTGFVALGLGRKYVGCELKESYWQTSQRYLREAGQRSQGDLFRITA